MDVNSGEWTGKMAGLGAGVGKDISPAGVVFGVEDPDPQRTRHHFASCHI
jgi:hypothetical protein